MITFASFDNVSSLAIRTITTSRWQKDLSILDLLASSLWSLPDPHFIVERRPTEPSPLTTFINTQNQVQFHSAVLQLLRTNSHRCAHAHCAALRLIECSRSMYLDQSFLGSVLLKAPRPPLPPVQKCANFARNAGGEAPPP